MKIIAYNLLPMFCMAACAWFLHVEREGFAIAAMVLAFLTAHAAKE